MTGGSSRAPASGAAGQKGSHGGNDCLWIDTQTLLVIRADCTVAGAACGSLGQDDGLTETREPGRHGLRTGIQEHHAAGKRVRQIERARILAEKDVGRIQHGDQLG